MQTINYLPLYEPVIKNCNQKTIWGLAVLNQGGTSFYQNIQSSSDYQLDLRLMTHQVAHQPGFFMQQTYQHPRDTPLYMIPNTDVQMMTVEQTASWIRDFGVHRGWHEAAFYGWIFSKNNISGSMLKYLNHEILKFDMCISNHLHRCCLLATIRQLFPFCYHRTIISEPTRLSDLRARDIKYNYYWKTCLLPKAGSADPLAEKLCTLPCLLADQDEIGMNLSSFHKIDKSGNLNNCSDMGYVESKCPSNSRIIKPFYEKKSRVREKSTAQAHKHMSRLVWAVWGGTAQVYLVKFSIEVSWS